MISSDWDYFYLDVAKKISEKSKDPSTKVGSVIVRPDNTVASVGYNGFPRKMPDADKYLTDRNEKYSRTIHAEMNAVIFAREPLHGYTVYTYPFMPCDRCVVHLAQVGISKFVTVKATQEQLIRWADSFNKSKQYCLEMGIELVEYQL